MPTEEKIVKSRMGRSLAAVLLLLAAVVCLVSCRTAKFNGSRTSNDSQFKMSYSIFNDTDSARLQLEDGDEVQVDIVSKSGKVDVKVLGDDGEAVYEQEDAPTGSFSLAITESGTYQFIVTGEKAEGSVSFVKEPAAARS